MPKINNIGGGIVNNANLPLHIKGSVKKPAKQDGLKVK